MKAQLIGIVLLTISSFGTAIFNSDQVSLQIEVTLQKDPPSITLQWQHTPIVGDNFNYQGAVFDVYRCDEPFDPSVGCLVSVHQEDVVLDTQNYTYIDTNIEVSLLIYWLTLKIFVTKFKFRLASRTST